MTENAMLAADAHRAKRYDVTIRTLAGHHHSEEVHDTEKVSTLTARAVKDFEAKGQLNPGDYALTLPRLGEAGLDPTARLHDAGVVRGDVLVLVSRTPQVDG